MTTCSYPSRAEACADRDALRRFGIESELLEYPADDGGVTWEVRTKDSSSTAAEPLHIASGHYIEHDPMDLDEATDYIESHWDREAQDREYRIRRGPIGGPSLGSPYE
jgi:hypothetical protein